jgi:hypothetical protein
LVQCLALVLLSQFVKQLVSFNTNLSKSREL